MNIVIFIGGLARGGAERVCCNLSNYLVRKKHEVTILTMSDVDSSYELESAVKREYLLLKNERKNFLYNAYIRYKRLRAFLKKTDCDVFLVMLPITILLSLFLRNLTSAKVIASERNMPTLYPRWQQYALKFFASKADSWLFQTEEQRLWYGKSLGNSKAFIIPNAINPIFLSKQSYSGLRDRRIVNVGRLDVQKNQALLINSFSKVLKQYPDLSLEIYGEGSQKNSLQELAKNLGVERNVIFKGFVKDISENIMSASLFVLSSDYEGIPNALLEAMAIGMPCISTDCFGGGAKLLIEDRKNGLLVPRAEEPSLTKAILVLLSDPDYASELGNRATEVKKRFSPEFIYGEWEDFIRKTKESK